MQKITAMIAMSGGVDSSVAAYLCKAQGYDCMGATMKLYGSEEQLANQIGDAAAVANRLDMPFYVFDCAQDFEKDVIDGFISCYEKGLTPNPCVTCNRCLKFGTFLRKAEELGCRYIVTGHYAKISRDPNTGRYLLKKAATQEKDQSYFLAQLDQNQLSHTLFPLGELTKPEVRQIAEEQGFINARRKDSQDICFVPDGDYVAFIRRHTGKTYPQGKYLDTAGNVVGTHQGAIAYTLGQRKGLGIALGQPMYVCAKDMINNTVTVGTNADLFHTTLRANDWNWIAIPELTAPLRVFAKARSRMAEQPATVYPEENGFARVVFDEPQRAITPGQAVVLYDGDTVVGGGTITEVI
jgi:tRNA-specific 2-thiouridylase